MDSFVRAFCPELAATSHQECNNHRNVLAGSQSYLSTLNNLRSLILDWFAAFLLLLLLLLVHVADLLLYLPLLFLFCCSCWLLLALFLLFIVLVTVLVVIAVLTVVVFALIYPRS